MRDLLVARQQQHGEAAARGSGAPAAVRPMFVEVWTFSACLSLLTSVPVSMTSLAPAYSSTGEPPLMMRRRTPSLERNLKEIYTPVRERGD